MIYLKQVHQGRNLLSYNNSNLLKLPHGSKVGEEVLYRRAKQHLITLYKHSKEEYEIDEVALIFKTSLFPNIIYNGWN